MDTAQRQKAARKSREVLSQIHPDGTVDLVTNPPSDRAVEAWGARLPIARKAQA